MVSYNGKELKYLETEPLGVGLGAGLMQARDRMWFPWSESPDSAVP